MLARVLLVMEPDEIREWLKDKMPQDLKSKLTGYTKIRWWVIKKVPYRVHETFGLNEWGALFIYRGIRTALSWQYGRGWTVEQTRPLTRIDG